MTDAEIYASGQWTLANLDLLFPRPVCWRVWLHGHREPFAVQTDRELPHAANSGDVYAALA